MTFAGMVAPAGDELRETETPPLGAAEVSETEQVVPDEGLIVVALQLRPLKLGVWLMVTVPAVTEVAISPPMVSAVIPPINWRLDEVLVVEDERVNVKVPTTPSGITVLFNPQTRQVMVPGTLLQDRVLPVSADPAAKVAEEKSVVE